MNFSFSSVIVRTLCCCLLLFPMVVRAEFTPITIHISHRVGNAPLRLDTSVYENALQQPFALTAVKYYVSAIRIHCEGNSDYVSNKFFLVDASDSTSTTITLPRVPLGTYRSISFTIGVDSAHNSSGTQEGALDPIRGMFWAWNTGYIFLKVEGTSPASPSPRHVIEYHVGGFRAPYNNIATINVPIIEDPTKGIYLEADVGALLHSIDFSKTPTATTPSTAKVITSHYEDLFRTVHRTVSGR